MPGSRPSRPWLNKEWQQYVIELSEDIIDLQVNSDLWLRNSKQLIEGIYGSQPGSRTFPALVTPTKDFTDEGCNYNFQELSRPRFEVDSAVLEGGAKGLCSNVYEEGLSCGSVGSGGTKIPPSIDPETHGDCFGDFDCAVEPIGKTSAVVVIMHAQVGRAILVPGDDEEPDTTCGECLITDPVLGDNVFYYFDAVVQPCFTCSEGEGDGGDSEPLVAEGDFSKPDMDTFDGPLSPERRGGY